LKGITVKKVEELGSECQGFLGKDVRFDGKILIPSGVFRIEGSIEGEIIGDILEIGETALIIGKLSGKIIRIEGTVQGEVKATEAVTICSHGILQGNLDTPKLKIEEGGILDGSCRMMEGIEEVKSLPDGVLGEVSQVSEATMAYRMKE
jgi:cytoskeletal protein CcmA (bactofilin family)